MTRRRPRPEKCGEVSARARLNGFYRRRARSAATPYDNGGGFGDLVDGISDDRDDDNGGGS